MKNTVLGRCVYRGAFVFFEEKNGDSRDEFPLLHVTIYP